MSDPFEEARIAAHKKAKTAVIRIQEELDALIRLTNHMREAYEYELNDGMGYKRLGISEALVRKGKDLAAMMDTLVKAKIAYDKASKSLAESMTPDEERSALMAYCKSITPKERNDFMRDLRTWMRIKNEDVSETL